jgi:hypothetical protein
MCRSRRDGLEDAGHVEENLSHFRQDPKFPTSCSTLREPHGNQLEVFPSVGYVAIRHQRGRSRIGSMERLV